MKKITKRMEKYTAVFEPDKNGGFTVTIPSLPGCVSEGDTFEEAARNIEEAAELYVEVMHAQKIEVPEEESGIFVAPVFVKV